MNATATLPLPLPDAVAPEADPHLRAVWQSLFAHKHPSLTFEQAMTVPFIRLGVRNAAEFRLRNRLACGKAAP
ncbi:MAG: hypothetical protein NT123_26405 [Proteobacteria bacterium]|nr:hypothetical protein [Pseudomonadota bacterium]